MILRLLPFLLTLSLVGCVSSASSLDGTEWTLQRAETPDGRVTPEADVPTLQIEDGRIAGSDGCNQFSGSVQAADGQIAVSHLASTKRACPPPFDALSKAILGVLDGQTVVHEVRGDELQLSAGGTTLVYSRR